MTPGDLVLRLLLRHAQGQLVDSARSVTDIAMRCGFATSQHFARRFRQYVGATPSEFRRRSCAASDDGGQVSLSDRPDRLAVVSGGNDDGPRPCVVT